jgi:hypothetical protein
MPRVRLDPEQTMTFHTGQTLGMRRLPIIWNADEVAERTRRGRMP